MSFLDQERDLSMFPFLLLSVSPTRPPKTRGRNPESCRLHSSSVEARVGLCVVVRTTVKKENTKGTHLLMVCCKVVVVNQTRVHVVRQTI